VECNACPAPTGPSVPVASVTVCGGFAGFPCPESSHQCMDYAMNGCDVNQGARDCFGVCVEPSEQCASSVECESHLCVEGACAVPGNHVVSELPEDPVCCEAITPECRACASGITVEDFCLLCLSSEIYEDACELCEGFPEQPVNKSGFCQTPQGYGMCVEMCNSDAVCPGEMKCCSNGCGLTCQAPVFTAPVCCQDMTPTCRSCSLGITVEQFCNQCSTGGLNQAACGACAGPTGEVPPGMKSCVGLPSYFLSCEDFGDAELCCDGRYAESMASMCHRRADKCVPRPNVTTTPQSSNPVDSTTKSGLCPTPQGYGICVEMCNSDAVCPGEMKCCSNGCGLTCQAPVFV